MRISYNWLQDYFKDPLPTPEEIGEIFTMHSFEVESINSRGEDTVFDIKVMPDRAHDCLSHQGIARELSVLTNLAVVPDKFGEKKLLLPESNTFSAEFEEGNLVRRFSAIVINNIEVKESPEWIKNKLTSIGQRPINNVVDATNIVMFEIGQPMHAYDLSKLSGDGIYKILIRKGVDGESFVSLDNKEYKVGSENLLITDGNNEGRSILGIAGVKGGIATEIDKNTKNILLESANFDPISIRKTAKALGLRTDASIRFENEITPELTTEALKFASDLILKIAGGDKTVIEGLFDWYPKKRKPYKIGVSVKEINDTLGLNISEGDIGKILEKANFIFEISDPKEKIIDTAKSLLGVPYKYGASISYDAPDAFDCSSFVSYVFSQSGVQIPRMTIDQYVFGDEIDESELMPGDIIFSQNDNTGEEKEIKILSTGENVKQKVRHTKTKEFFSGQEVSQGIDHNGLYLGDGKVIHASGMWHKGEVVIEDLSITPAFKNIRGYRRMIFSGESRFIVTIPSKRLDLMSSRSFLVSGNREDLIEEIGRIYGYSNIASKAINKDKVAISNKFFYYSQVVRGILAKLGFSEVYTYTFEREGEIELENPLAKDKAFLRNNLRKSVGKALEDNVVNAELFGLESVKIFEIGKVFRDGGEYSILALGVKNAHGYKKNKESDYINEALDLLSKKLNFNFSQAKQDENIYEIDFGGLLSKLNEPKEAIIFESNKTPRYKPFSPYPFVLRDIAVFVPKDIKNEELLKVIINKGTDLLTSFRLFDVFTKEFPDGEKTSYAYRLVFQSHEKTLTDEEVNAIMNQINESINNLGWQVR